MCYMCMELFPLAAWSYLPALQMPSPIPVNYDLGWTHFDNKKTYLIAEHVTHA